MSCVGIAGHIFFDLLNSFGVVLFYPLSVKRYEFACVFIIDLILLALLIAPFAVAPIIGRWKMGNFQERVWRISMSLVLFYVVFCFAARGRAQNILSRVILENNMNPDFQYVFPEALGPHRFKGVVKEKENIQLYQIELFGSKSRLMETFHTDENNPDVAKLRELPHVKEIEWFFKAPVWKKIDQGSDEFFQVFDLRFASTVLPMKTARFSYRFKKPL